MLFSLSTSPETQMVSQINHTDVRHKICGPITNAEIGQLTKYFNKISGSAILI